MGGRYLLPFVQHNGERVAAFYAIAPGGYATVESQPPIAKPSRIVVGSADVNLSPAEAARIAAHFGSSLLVVEGAGHFLMDDAPDEINTDVITWLSQLPRGSE